MWQVLSVNGRNIAFVLDKRQIDNIPFYGGPRIRLRPRIVAIKIEQLYVEGNTKNKQIMRKGLDKILNKYKILAKLGGMYLTFLELRGEVLEQRLSLFIRLDTLEYLSRPHA